MNVVATPRIATSNSSNDKNIVPIDWYREIPNCELSLDEFEEYALLRLEVLKKIEELKIRNVTNEKYVEAVKKALKKSTLKNGTEMDKVSHFILRAAYCHTEDLRRWFTAQELFLMQYRLENELQSQLDSELKANSSSLHPKESGMGFISELKPISKEMKHELSEKLQNVPGSNNPTEFASNNYYEVPFEKALKLVQSRTCYLHHGKAYLPQSKVVTILLENFRSKLSRSLALAGAAFGSMIEGQNRVAPLLKYMHNVNSSASSNAQDHSIDALGGINSLTSASVDSTLLPHMPLCMQQIHKGLQRDGKIRHWARLQYGLFLKGAGLSMEESLRFFQTKFHALTSSDQFNKEYAYNIRHMYGKEGKRANYTPYSCTKIILGIPPPTTREDHHGCPFRHCDETNLSRLLWDHVKLHNTKTTATPVAPDIQSRAIQEILKLKRENHYQLACVKHFELLHPSTSRGKNPNTPEVGNHPNAWLVASYAYSSDALDESKRSSSSTPASPEALHDVSQDSNLMDFSVTEQE